MESWMSMYDLYASLQLSTLQLSERADVGFIWLKKSFNFKEHFTYTILPYIPKFKLEHYVGGGSCSAFI